MDKKIKSLVRKGVLVGVGVAAYTKEKTEKVVKELVRRENISKAEGKKLVRALYLEAEKSGKKLASMVEKELKRALKTTKKPAKKKKAKKKR